MKLTRKKVSIFLRFILIALFSLVVGCSLQKIEVTDADNQANRFTETGHPSSILSTAEIQSSTITQGSVYPNHAEMTITPAYSVLEPTTPTPYSTEIPVPTQTSQPKNNEPCSSDYKNPTLILTPDQKSGWCTLDHPLDDTLENYGYSLNYPNHWSVRLAGYVNANLMFNDYSTSGDKPEVFILWVYSTLPLKMADQAISNDNGKPLIDSSEIKLHNEIVTISNKETLVVDSQLDHNRMKYYFFFLEAGNQTNRQRFLFMVRAKVDQSEINAEAFSRSLKEIELLIESFEFYSRD